MELLLKLVKFFLAPSRCETEANENVDLMKFNARTHIDMSNGEYTDVTNPHGVKTDSDHWL